MTCNHVYRVFKTIIVKMIVWYYLSKCFVFHLEKGFSRSRTGTVFSYEWIGVLAEIDRTHTRWWYFRGQGNILVKSSDNDKVHNVFQKTLLSRWNWDISRLLKVMAKVNFRHSNFNVAAELLREVGLLYSITASIDLWIWFNSNLYSALLVSKNIPFQT